MLSELGHNFSETRRRKTYPGRGEGRRRLNYSLSSLGRKAYSYDVVPAWCIKTFRRIGNYGQGK